MWEVVQRLLEDNVYLVRGRCVAHQVKPKDASSSICCCVWGHIWIKGKDEEGHVHCSETI